MWMKRAITWDCYQALQLLLKVHDVFAQLDVIHPAETEKHGQTGKPHPVWMELARSHLGTGPWDLPA